MKVSLRNRRGSEDGIAMLTALLLIMIVAAVAVAVSGLVISQTRPTQQANKSQRTLAAATAGFDAALNKIRAANDGAGNGIRVDLPCTANNTSSPTLTGNVSQNSGNLTYSVRIRYYQADPTNKPDSWLNSSSNMVSCPSGYPAQVPAFAYIESTGRGTDVQGTKANTGNRTLHTVYPLKTTNSNVAGGRLAIYSTSPAMCMDVGDPLHVTVGTQLTVQPCLALGTPSQQFTYLTTMQIEWTGSANSQLCIEAQPTTNSILTLNTCAPRPATTPWTNSAWAVQGWGYDDSGRFEGTNQSNGGWDGQCFGTASASPVAGATVIVEACSGTQTQWNSDPSVGSGEAGSTSGNLVNYLEFARCMDVTHQDINAGWMIDYPCKQKADVSQFTWNQIWAFNGNGTITTNAPGGLACLTPTSGSSQGSAAAPNSPPSSGNLAIVVTSGCSATGSVGTYQKWSQTLDTGDYATSYNIKTANGLCLAIEQPGFNAPYDTPWGRIVVETCNGGLNQKWNAPPNVTSNTLKGTQEGAGGG